MFSCQIFILWFAWNIYRRTPVGWWWNGLTPLGWMIPSQLVLALQLRVSRSLKWASCFSVTPGSLAAVNSQKQGLEKFEYLFPLPMDLLFCLRLSVSVFVLFCFFWPASVVLWLLSLHPSPNSRLILDRFSCSYFRTNLYLRIYVRMWWKAVINNPT